ncbi:H-NS histone family protein [Rubellimicrobium arenae]|uniref:H-NS histone family protein n=1 Tax=Rubellimicrobium arenae TaxID=2817372 RepID=UPI001FEF35DD|nr:H-NS histone family protein [Rubellimicrobium arenae]
MMDPDLTAQIAVMSRAELKQLKQQVEHALDRNELRHMQDAIAAVTQAVHEFGFSLQEILDFQEEAERKRLALSRQSLGSRLYNPEDPLKSWSGRGRRPAWLVRHLKAGKSLDDLRAWQAHSGREDHPQPR